MHGLGGGRRPARKRAFFDPTAIAQSCGRILAATDVRPESQTLVFPKASLIPSRSRARCKIAVLNWGQVPSVIMYPNSAFGIVSPAEWGALPWNGNSQEVLAWLTVCVVLRGDGRC